MSLSELKYPTVVSEDPEEQYFTGVQEDDKNGRFQAQSRIIPEKVSTTHARPAIGNTVPDVVDSSDIVLEKKDIPESTPDKKDAVKHLKQTADRDKENFNSLHRKVDVFKTVTVQINNGLTTKSISDFSIYVTSGKSFSVPPDDIAAGNSESFLFFKTPWSFFRGVVGILTFGIEGIDDGLAIYFCNPFIGHNEFGLDWIQVDRNDGSATYPLIQSFWHKRQLNKKRWVVRDSMKKKEIASSSGYRASAFMTQGEHVKMSVKIYEK